MSRSTSVVNESMAFEKLRPLALLFLVELHLRIPTKTPDMRQ